MSWRLVTRKLFDGPRSTSDLSSDLTIDRRTLDRWLREAKTLGAVESSEVGRHRITAMGLAYIEGRVELRQRRPGGYEWRATWMQPLPRYAA